MAQGVAFNLVGKVLELLSPFIHEEIKLACDVNAELENLKSTVSTESSNSVKAPLNV